MHRIASPLRGLESHLQTSTHDICQCVPVGRRGSKSLENDHSSTNKNLIPSCWPNFGTSLKRCKDIEPYANPYQSSTGPLGIMDLHIPEDSNTIAKESGYPQIHHAQR
ncbi:UNVERIFIED_CONTAM: hypothetical protein Sradi_1537000 [Sesamum radiatum]|uniref:Uncharacterized protein n=1 Tax=Sesamum radiatum TaxID=300843 RepID=A0AAW2U8B2_SESRA